MSTCHCGSGRPFAECCQPILLDERLAATAEDLMRARYTAYVIDRIDFLGASLHPEHRREYDEAATRRWARQSEWLSLEVVSSEAGGPADERGSVEFVASYREKGPCITTTRLANSASSTAVGTSLRGAWSRPRHSTADPKGWPQ